MRLQILLIPALSPYFKQVCLNKFATKHILRILAIIILTIPPHINTQLVMHSHDCEIKPNPYFIKDNDMLFCKL